MQDQTQGRQSSVTRTSGLYLLLVLAAIIFAAVGAYLAWRGQGWAMLAAGAGSLLLMLGLGPLLVLQRRQMEESVRLQRELQTTWNERLEQISILLNMISEQQLLSDRAKSVAFREKDRDAVRGAIREEMGRQDWEAALALIADMEQTFGYRQEADRLREEIAVYREEHVRKQINDGLAVIERNCRAEKWAEALREAEQLTKQYPEHELTRDLPRQIDARRMNHKQQLVESWKQLVERKDVDGAIEILRQLDVYLTPAEAETMQEGARNIFKAKLESLKGQFSTCVQERRWAEAVRIGEGIIRDFPNSRIAQEVQENMAGLRQRAAGEPATV